MSDLTIDHIRDPLWTRPTIIEPGNPFTVLLDLPNECYESLAIRVVSRWSARELTIECIRPASAPGLYRVRVATPADLVPDRYELEIAWPGGADRMPGAVVVSPSDRTRFRVVHIADPHVSSVMTDEPGAALANVVDQLAVLDPDLVLVTGDLVYRYGPDKEVLSATTIDHDLSLAQSLLLKIDAPLCLTAGNHDLAYPWLRRRYRARFARPIDGDADAYDVRLGEVSFHTVEAYRYYEADPPVDAAVGPNAQQLEALRRGLDAASDVSTRVMFYHYDYNGVLDAVFDAFSVDLALCGHTTPMVEESIGTTPTLTIRDLPVFEDGHVRLLEFEQGELTRNVWWRSSKYAHGRPVGVTFDRPNDGTERRNRATVYNRTDHAFEDCRIRFELRAGAYSMSNGTCGRQADTGNGTTTCDVRVDLASDSVKRIAVEPR